MTISLAARMYRQPHLQAIVSALSRPHAVVFPASLLLFDDGLKDSLMTLCDFEINRPRYLTAKQTSTGIHSTSCAGNRTR
jgi:hypothetical protein